MNEVSKGDGEKEVDGSGQVRSFEARSLPFYFNFYGKPLEDFDLRNCVTF